MKKIITLFFGILFILSITTVVMIKLEANGLRSEAGNKDNPENKSQPVQQITDENQKERDDLTVQVQSDPVEELLKQMSLKEKIGQLFIIDIQKDANGNNITEINNEVKQKIIKHKVGGVVLFKSNIITKNQTKHLIKEMQKVSKIPLFISVDEEGGSVSRIGTNKNITAVPFKSAFSMGQKGDPKLAYEEAERMGGLLYSLGFNMDFAPVADIYNNKANTVIGTRSFGKTKEQVSPMVISFSKGLLSQNVQPVIKHFPGHGNTTEDSHDGLAYIHKTKVQLEKEELVPFIKAVDNGIDVLMRGHLVVKDIDNKYPATLSKKWFDYMKTLIDTKKVLMITDAMNMGAVAKNYSDDEAIVLSFLAGNDMILMPKDIEKAVNAIYKAHESGRVTDERINESVRKILSKKVERKIVVLE